MKLSYEAYDRGGAPSNGVIDAATTADAMQQLQQRGLFVARIAPKTQEQAKTVRPLRRGGKGLMLFTKQFHVLIAVGTPIDDALQSLERQARNESWKQLIRQLRERIEGGDSLAEAMAHHPAVFDEVYRALIAAGESTGRLKEMVERLADLTRKRIQLQQTLVGAMTYPTVLVTVAMSVMLLMLLFVVPRFEHLFKTLNVPVPGTTKVIMGFSHVLHTSWWLILIGLVTGIVGLWKAAGTTPGRHFIDNLLLRLPVVGSITRSMQSAKLARTLGMLVDSKVPLLEALELLRATFANHRYVALLKHGEQALSEGEPLSSALDDDRLIVPSVYEAVRSGEQSSNIAPSLLSAADFMDEENAVLVRSLTSILEPVILVGLGLLVGALAISLFLPLFDMTSMV